MSKIETEVTTTSRKTISGIEYVGLSLVGLSLIGLFFGSNHIAGMFDAMVNKAFGIFNVFIFGKNIGAAIDRKSVV